MAKQLSIAALLAACLAIAALQAQPIPWENSQLYERLGLSEQQAAGIQEVVNRENRVAREAQAELNIYKAQLEKLLLSIDPDMRQVERLLQSTVDWKLKSEMAEIRRRVEIRKIVGEQKWEQILRTWRARNGRGADTRSAAPTQQRPQPEQPRR